MTKAIILALTLILLGCNTVDGIGRDISGAAHRAGSYF